MALLTEAQVKSYVGKSISDICENQYTTTAWTHCAHFVSHALGIKLRTLCGDMTWKAKHTGATLRCNELFNNLVNRGEWQSRPAGQAPLLIFIISAKSVKNNCMDACREKHVGIYFSGPVYNYSQQYNRVIEDKSVDSFYKRINNIYDGDDISLYYGVPPLS